jgi:hypothetical protein
VLAKGDDVDVDVAVGDRVLFSKYSSSGERPSRRESRGSHQPAAGSPPPLPLPPVIPAPHPLAFAAADVEVPDGEICFVAQKSILAKLS